MTKSRILKRALTVITVLALIICFAQTAVFADNTVEIKSGTWDGSKIHVTGSISTKGAEITMLAVKTDDENVELSSYQTPEQLAAAVQFIDQETVKTDDLSLTWDFALRDGVDDKSGYVVVFMSGTDADLTKEVISLESVITGVNGTVTFDAGTDFVGSLPAQFFTTEGGDENWKGQLAVTIKDAEGTEVEGASADKDTGAVTITAPDEKTSYTITVANTSADYPNYSVTKTFTLISEAGAAAAAAQAALDALPANLGVTVERGEDSDTFTIPEDTDTIAYTVTVDGEPAEVTDGKITVPKAVEGGEEATKAVVVTATAKGTDKTKTAPFSVYAKDYEGPAIAEGDVEIIKDKAGKGVYYDQLGNGNVIVTIAAGEIDPDTKNITVGGKEFYYVASRNYFVGIVPEYTDKAALIADVVISDEASGRIRYGKAPSAVDQDGEITAADYGEVMRIYLGKIAEPTEKQLLAFDVGGGVMDGEIGAVDYGTVMRVYLGKEDDFAINNPA